MIFQKEGEINQIIYNNITLSDGKHNYYPSVDELFYIISLIIHSNQTTKSLSITPFYHNGLIRQQVEFKNMNYYIECRENVSLKQREMFLKECCGENEEIDEDKKIRYCLCDTKDLETFQNSIRKYQEYLTYLIPKMTDILLEDYKFEVNDLLFGYICFEIYSE